MSVPENKTRIMITLDNEQLDIIDTACDIIKCTRSEFVSTCVDGILLGLDKKSKEEVEAKQKRIT